MKNKIHKKIKVDPRMKLGVLILLVGIIAFMVVLIVKEATARKIEYREETLYQYNCQPKVDYEVHIKKNKVYDGTVLPEGTDYTKSLMETIQAKFTIEFQGSREAEANLEYTVIAQVRGYKSGPDSKRIIWSKDYVLKPTTHQTFSSGEFLEEAVVYFDLEEYDAFVKEAREITEMQLESEVLVCLDGNLNIKTQYGELATPVGAAIAIPLMSNVFSISKAEIPALSDSITTYHEAVVPLNHIKIRKLSLVIVACVIGMILVAMVCEAPNLLEKLDAKARRFLKNYGSRMIVLQGKSVQDYIQTYEVISINDLIKISDEIQKPIYYFNDEYDLRDFSFYVSDGVSLYVYHLI